MSEKMDFAGGKYTVINDNGKLTALRYGEPWGRDEDLVGDNLVYSMLMDSLQLTAQRDALLKLLKDLLPVAEDASESLGRFCSDEGWAQEDMDRMDNVDGMLPLMRAAIKAVEE